MERAPETVTRVSISVASPADAQAIAELRNAVAEDLTARFGGGHWSSHCTARGVRFGMKFGDVLLAKSRGRIVGTLRLASKKPWAIDLSYFTAVPCAIYLLDMAIVPRHQGKGIGRRLMAAAQEAAIDWPADAIRLDAYDADAGAGGFYLKCGYTALGRREYRGVPLRYFELVLTA
jgi:GNAT superfamily N-acetyltransferase